MSFKKTDNPLHMGAKGKLFSNARMLRKTSTEAELLLWSNLRNKRLKGFKFRRQHPITRYIADFYCHEAKLIIELDGGIHNLPDYQEHDEGRTFELENDGIQVIRFTNTEILDNIVSVLDKITAILNNTLPAE
jgi:very-short-patch-repair endonuclease